MNLREILREMLEVQVVKDSDLLCLASQTKITVRRQIHIRLYLAEISRHGEFEERYI